MALIRLGSNDKSNSELVKMVSERLKDEDKEKRGGFIQALLPYIIPAIGEAAMWGYKKLTGNGMDCECKTQICECDDVEGEGVVEYKKRGRKSKKNNNKKIKGGNINNIVNNLEDNAIVGRGMARKNKRADIVRKVMKEKGLSMIEASKYVKKNNLY